MNQKYNILIVDNEGDSALETVREHLSLEGHRIDTVGEGQNALELIRQDKYHIVLIHIKLPDMDGIELLKEIKNFDPLAQVIMMSSDSNMNNVIAALEYGANEYIHKPLSHSYVAEVIGYSIEKLERWRKAMIYLIQ